jgi:hypothetical protein
MTIDNLAERQADYTEQLRERFEAEHAAEKRSNVRQRISKTDVGVDPWWQALNANT